MTQGVCCLGISGSVGTSLVNVLRKFPEQFTLKSFSVHTNITQAKAYIQEFQPKLVCISGIAYDPELKTKFLETEIVYGEKGLAEIVSLQEVDVVVTSVVGAIGFAPTEVAIRKGKKIAIANKETLVTFGPYIQNLLNTYKTTLIPVDSEHNALFQLLESRKKEEVRKIYLTASGGSFRDWPIEKLESVTVEDALKHPTWKMGPKITIDSAGLINKGLEVIEAHFLFGVSYEQIDVVIHPESIVHGMVELIDGSILAYASHPDMQFPVAHSLFYPAHVPNLLFERPPVSWKSLQFLEVNEKKYPGFKIAVQAGKTGGSAPAIFNAANEIACDSFLERKISFLAIPKILEEAMQKISVSYPTNSAGYLEKDREAREFVHSYIQKGGGKWS